MTQNSQTHQNSDMRNITNTITDEKLNRYFKITQAARDKVKDLNTQALQTNPQVADMFDMIERYISDAHHFKSKGDYVNAFAALNYAHGWLDCGARLKLFYVAGDNVLFTVDEE
jgi:uncharacterized protein